MVEFGGDSGVGANLAGGASFIGCTCALDGTGSRLGYAVEIVAMDFGNSGVPNYFI